MKKLTAVVLAGVLAAAALTGCGGSGSSSAAPEASSAAGNSAASEAGSAAGSSAASETGSAASAEAGSFTTVEDGVLIMATNAYFPPYEYYEGEEVVGIDVEIAQAIAEKFKPAGDAAAKYETTYGKGFQLNVSQDGAKVTFTMSAPPTAAWNVDSAVTITGLDNDAKTPGSGNQAHGLEVRTLVEPVDSSAGRRYAQADLDLANIQSKIKDGATLTIGDTTYTFAVGKKSAFKELENVIDLTDMTLADIKNGGTEELGKIANRITTAAKDNKNFKVTANSAVDSNADGILHFTELEGGVDTENYKLEGENNKTTSDDGDWAGLIKLGTINSDAMGTALTLQIGDTSDSYNQLKVSIGDIHTKALGIDKIDISTQAGAAAAVNTIKTAINNVSSIRGTLGATQNRLEHTQNNLSVMKENIQDAESTIRDTDIAEEMMSYTKNNILVQSAQAMLAQANQVPQGVLQLLG